MELPHWRNHELYLVEEESYSFSARELVSYAGFEHSIKLATAYTMSWEVLWPLSHANQVHVPTHGIRWNFPSYDEIVSIVMGVFAMLEAMRLAVEFLETILVHLYVALEPIYIRVASVIQAELRVILLGPKLAWSRGYRRISVDSGSLNMLKMLWK